LGQKKVGPQPLVEIDKGHPQPVWGEGRDKRRRSEKKGKKRSRQKDPTIDRCKKEKKRVEREPVPIRGTERKEPSPETYKG